MKKFLNCICVELKCQVENIIYHLANIQSLKYVFYVFLWIMDALVCPNWKIPLRSLHLGNWMMWLCLCVISILLDR